MSNQVMSVGEIYRSVTGTLQFKVSEISEGRNQPDEWLTLEAMTKLVRKLPMECFFGGKQDSEIFAGAVRQDGAVKTYGYRGNPDAIESLFKVMRK